MNNKHKKRNAEVEIDVLARPSWPNSFQPVPHQSWPISTNLSTIKSVKCIRSWISMSDHSWMRRNPRWRSWGVEIGLFLTCCGQKCARLHQLWNPSRWAEWIAPTLQRNWISGSGGNKDSTRTPVLIRNSHPSLSDQQDGSTCIDTWGKHSSLPVLPSTHHIFRPSTNYLTLIYTSDAICYLTGVKSSLVALESYLAINESLLVWDAAPAFIGGSIRWNKWGNSTGFTFRVINGPIWNRTRTGEREESTKIKPNNWIQSARSKNLSRSNSNGKIIRI